MSEEQIRPQVILLQSLNQFTIECIVRWSVSCKMHANDALTCNVKRDLHSLWANSFSQSSVQKMWLRLHSHCRSQICFFFPTLEIKCHQWIKPLLIYRNGLTCLHKRDVGSHVLLCSCTWQNDDQATIAKLCWNSYGAVAATMPCLFHQQPYLILSSTSAISFQQCDSHIKFDKAV